MARSSSYSFWSSNQKVIKGMDVVDKIAKAPRDRANDKPLEDIKIINIVEE